MKKFKTVDIPQANSLQLVGDLIALVDVGFVGNKRLGSELGIDQRQVDYYKHAARVLGFLEPSRDKPVVSDLGKRFLKSVRVEDKHTILVDAVRNTQIVKFILDNLSETELNKSSISKFLEENSDLKGATAPRRASTIIAWLKTIDGFDYESYTEVARNRKSDFERKVRAYSARGEGATHRALKYRLCHTPSLIENNLTCIEMEYRFPTTDKIDLLFEDSRSRFLAVEVENEVGVKDIEGLLQATKYKYMAAIYFGRSFAETRGMLVAHWIHPFMKTRAKRYGIETREIEQE